MNETLRAAFVIGRRDFVATVGSRTFLLFLLGPLLPILFGLVFAAIGASVEPTPIARPVAVIAPPQHWAAILASRDRLAPLIGGDALPELRLVTPEGDQAAQARRLIESDAQPAAAVLAPGRAGAALYGPDVTDADSHQARMLRLLIEDARRSEALASAGPPPPPVTLSTIRIERATPPAQDRSREATARAGQAVLLVLTMILAGMLLSNLLEEKGSKVIEVLAAAVPTHAIFLGKLFAMLCMSLVGIAVWSTAGIIGFMAFAPPGLMPPTPAIGWPGFVALGLIYFTSSYLLLGAVFLGIGAQASTVREVQTLSMPVTMSQLVVFGFASVAATAPASGLAIAASIFPLSSPLAMIARAAQSPVWWPHIIAILWQAIWVAIIIRIAAARFRTSVLKSGGARKRWFGRKARG